MSWSQGHPQVQKIWGARDSRVERSRRGSKAEMQAEPRPHLGLLQGRLQLQLLYFQLLADLLQLMDILSSFSQLLS